MNLARLALGRVAIPFRESFRHASAERSETDGVWVEAVTATGQSGFGEGCPRPYVTGETQDSVRAFFLRHRASLVAGVHDLVSLRAWMAERHNDVDANPAAWCAIELALLDLLGREQGEPVEALLGLPPLRGVFRYTAVVGDSDPGTFAAACRRYRTAGFSDFKVKLSGDLARDRAKVDALRTEPVAVRADANNLWSGVDVAAGFLRQLDFPFTAIEEPLAANQYAELAALSRAIGVPVILDESLLRAGQIASLPADGGWIVNLRVSKMGGLLRSLHVLDAARHAGIPVIVGAQVGETSVLTRAGLTVAHAAGDACLAQEGAFGTFLLAGDVCEPPLMFGAGGRLDTGDHAAPGRPGLGLDVHRDQGWLVPVV